MRGCNSGAATKRTPHGILSRNEQCEGVYGADRSASHRRVLDRPAARRLLRGPAVRGVRRATRLVPLPAVLKPGARGGVLGISYARHA